MQILEFYSEYSWEGRVLIDWGRTQTCLTKLSPRIMNSEYDSSPTALRQFKFMVYFQMKLQDNVRELKKAIFRTT